MSVRDAPPRVASSIGELSSRAHTRAHSPLRDEMGALHSSPAVNVRTEPGMLLTCGTAFVASRWSNTIKSGPGRAVPLNRHGHALAASRGGSHAGVCGV